MQPLRRTRAALAALLIVAAARASDAQAPATGTETRIQAPGPQYKAGAFTRTLLGSGWRDVWTTPTPAPILDPDTYLGGLKFLELGGGFHSRVVHFQEENGWKEYRFRTVDKFPMQGSPDAVKGTLVGRVMEDQVSILFPAAPLMVPPLLEAIGALSVDVDLAILGDSPKLGDVREMMVGEMGTFELKGQEAPDDQPGFAGSRKIKGTEKFLDDLVDNRWHRLDEREFLAVRLLDMFINDPDRSPDNFDWARFGEKGAYTWRPIARDRDQAFMNARGLVNSLIIRRIYAKQVAFSEKYPLKGLTYSTHFLDRKLLQRLSAADFHAVALRVQQALDNAVIDEAVAQLPQSWRDNTGADEEIVRVLRARREQLPSVAMAYYRTLAREVDVRATDEVDRIEVARHDDGRVTVTIGDPLPTATMAAVTRADGSVETVSGGTVAKGHTAPFFQRTFIPGETDEVRIYAFGGDDVAVVRGSGSSAITVRVIGGEGNDTLADSAGGATVLYDAEGENVLTAASGTRVDTRTWKPVTWHTNFRAGGDWKPDFGRSSGWRPMVDYNTGAGLVLGAGPRFRKYGFRRLPFHWQGGANVMVGTGNGRLGANGEVEYRAENSPLGFSLEGRATQLEATRFFGYGNNTTDLPRSASLVDQNEYIVEPTLLWGIGWREREGGGNPLRGEDTLNTGMRPMVGELRAGAVLGWIDPEPTAGSALLTSGVRGASGFGLAGAQLGLELDHTDRSPIPSSGWTLEAEVSGFPALGSGGAFGTAELAAATYLPLTSGGAHIALRGGGALSAGDYPAQFAATIGGRRTVRGFSYRRFAGDRSVNTGAELRVPVGTVNFIVRSQLGLFALADAGRVWFDGASEGGWHTGVGGGFWLASLGRAVSVAYAHGEGHRFYVRTGLSY